MKPNTVLAIIFYLFFVLLLGGCANFERLQSDLFNLEEKHFKVFLKLENSYHPDAFVRGVYLGRPEGGEIIDHLVFLRPGEFEIWLRRQGGSLFAYADLNGDSTYQATEPYDWAHWEDVANANSGEIGQMKISIEPIGSGQHPPPVELVDQNIDQVPKIVGFNEGSIATLEDERFSPEVAEDGLWRPIGMLTSGVTGLYFLEPYDPGRIPVVFVHGIGGTPRNFGSIIEALDTVRFQPWFMYYPSGFKLSSLSRTLHQIIETLRIRHGFRHVHIIAHSMGGLVSREYVNLCIASDGCEYVRTFISIASPFGGIIFAEWGIEYSPIVVPVWNDLTPKSDFLADLFKSDLPDSLQHYLLFAYRNTSLILTTSSDGVIDLSSQLRVEAQNQAIMLRGFDQSHVGVLDDPELHSTINKILDER